MRLLLILAILLACSQTFAFDFKGVAVGRSATASDIKEKLGVNCGEGYENMQVCNGDVTIAHAPAAMNLVISPKGIVERIALTISPDAFDEIAPELVRKFGKPTTITRSTVQNRMGAKYPQIRYLWAAKDGAEVLYIKYASTLDRSTLNFSTKADRTRLKKESIDRKGDM
jgi:hypothetical protein